MFVFDIVLNLHDISFITLRICMFKFRAFEYAFSTSWGIIKFKIIRSLNQWKYAINFRCAKQAIIVRYGNVIYTHVVICEWSLNDSLGTH